MKKRFIAVSSVRPPQKETIEASGTPDAWRQRFYTALLPCALLVFIYWFFGPLELIHANQSSIGVDALTALPWYAAAFMLLTLLLSALLALFRGAYYENGLKAIAAFALASYIQGNFLNPNFGLLNGALIDWREYTAQANVGLLLWAGVFAAVYAACRLLKKHRFRLLCGVSAMLILMQGAALVSVCADCAKARQTKQGTPFYFRTDAQLEIADRENVIIFMLDSLSNQAVEEMLQKYPDRFDHFTDFTYYTHCAPTYYATFPEMLYILTGSEYDYTRVSHETYRAQAWKGEKAQAFYAILEEKGFYRQILASSPATYAARYEDLEGCIDNIAPSETQLVVPSMLKAVSMLTNFRYFPLALKSCYLIDDSEFSAATRLMDADTGMQQQAWNWDGIAFYDALRHESMTLTRERNMFTLFDLKGAHAPYTLSEGATEDDALGSGTRHAQCYGMFRIIDEYLAQLPDYIYQNATIIIMADHGDTDYGTVRNSAGAALFIKEKNETHDVMPRVDTPVDHTSLLPTIVKAVAPERAAAFGTPFDEVTRGTPTQQRIHIWHGAVRQSGFNVFMYDHGGDINAAFNKGWKPSGGDKDSLLAVYDAVDYFY
ncbi:MAG: hypothetical protein Q4E65_04030 [Clostridia bacterium]|nr:hypothetical protein [Clostridia bacterium]